MTVLGSDEWGFTVSENNTLSPDTPSNKKQNLPKIRPTNSKQHQRRAILTALDPSHAPPQNSPPNLKLVRKVFLLNN